jgi:hypothetical protein
MDCDDELELTTGEDCKLKQYERNKYFYGKLMTVSDFKIEQNYFNQKRHLINRHVLGSGIVCGLEPSMVEKTEEKCFCGPEGEMKIVDKWIAQVSAGVALDCMGREIVVCKSGKYFVSEEEIPETPEKRFPEFFGLYIKRKDRLKSPVSSPANKSSCDEICCYSHIEEEFELVFGELSRPVKILFDRTTYAPDDVVTVHLVEPAGSGENETNSRTVTL